MFYQIITIADFILDAFLRIWPYLLITIPLAVAVQMSGASKYINRAFSARPVTAIFLATLVGAFSPFCSCSVIPVVASLLIGGVPLAPVMAFWIASPSMDPEVFFLSVATIGWELAVWRLAATLLLSLSAGFATHLIVRQGWLGHSILRTHQVSSVQSGWTLLKQGWQNLKSYAKTIQWPGSTPALAAEPACCGPVAVTMVENQHVAGVALTTRRAAGDGGATSTACGDSCGSTEAPAPAAGCGLKPPSFRRRLLAETWSAATMVIKFMALAFFLEALITLYIPSEWIAGLLGGQNFLAILLAALIGVPVYTGNLTALPMVSGLLTQGMHPAAGLAFLIAGPTTTLPAMAAVWGLTTRRVFALYVSISLVGAVVIGYLYALVSSF